MVVLRIDTNLCIAGPRAMQVTKSSKWSDLEVETETAISHRTQINASLKAVLLCVRYIL